MHVCRRWRQIIFDSPRHLDIGILCTDKTPVSKNLNIIWPHLPIAIDCYFPRELMEPEDGDDIIAALEDPDRVCYLRLRWRLPDLWLEKVSTMMQKPFPALRSLTIHAVTLNRYAPFLSADFLGGSVPRLQEISLLFISFPALPTLLSSTRDIVTLDLQKIPPSGYISPGAMVECLAMLPRLKTFVLGFQSATFHPDQMDPPPITRSVLPALTVFDFSGSSQYLEALVVRVNGPQLSQIAVVHWDQVGDTGLLRRSRFIHRSGGPRSILFRHAQVNFYRNNVTFCLYSHANHPSSEPCPGTFISYDRND